MDCFTALGGFAQGWGELRLDPWIVREGLAQEAFCVALKASGLEFEIRGEPQHNQEVVVLRTGVEVWPRSTFGDRITEVVVTDGFSYQTLQRGVPNTFSAIYDRATQRAYYQFSSEPLHGED